MLNPVELLYHFTRSFDSLKHVATEGFKPSYARETLIEKNIMVPMVSFSNILLRDVGEDEVLNYGHYAIGLHRDWGIANGLDPVAYVYDKSLLEQGLHASFYASLFLSRLDNFKEYIEKLAGAKRTGPFSDYLKLKGAVTKEAILLLDYLGDHYDEELLNLLTAHAKSIHEATFPTLSLIKPYRVTNKGGAAFIAYNDREWRKLYPGLDILFENQKSYDDFAATPKPHFSEDKHRLKFDISDVKVIVVANDTELKEMIQLLINTYGDSNIDKLRSSGSLTIGTLAQLQKLNF